MVAPYTNTTSSMVSMVANKIGQPPLDSFDSHSATTNSAASTNTASTTFTNEMIMSANNSRSSSIANFNLIAGNKAEPTNMRIIETRIDADDIISQIEHELTNNLNQYQAK